jgi:hypothetical protein
VLVDVHPIEITMFGVDHDLAETKSYRLLRNRGQIEGRPETANGSARSDFGSKTSQC